MAKTTLQFLADELGVSKSLISKVLNGKEVGVSDIVRQNILDIAEKYHYKPNRMAVSLSDKKSQIIGCVIPNAYFDYFGQLFYWIERCARDYGYNVMMCSTDENNQREREYLQLYQTSIVDGLIVIPCDDHSNFDLYQEMQKEEFPFVFLDRYVNGVNASLVSTDNKGAYYFLTKKLIDRGHKKILYVGHSFSAASTVQMERYRGYAKAMFENNLYEQSVNIMGDIDTEGHLLAGILSLPKENRPTALIMISSQDIYSVLKICKKNGLVIPRDLEIAAIDETKIPITTEEDLELLRIVEKPMLMLEQKMEVLARKTVEFLMDQIEKRNTAPQVYRAHALYNGDDIAV